MTQTPPPLWDTLWSNVHLVTLADASGYGIIENAALAVKDSTLAWLGKMEALPAAPETLATTVKDGNGAWITPGLIDCHTHLVYGGTRATEWEMRLHGKSYAEIAQSGGGILSTVTATREASEDSLLAQAAARLTALMAEGVTTIEIKSGYGLDLENELKMLRVARRLGEQYPVTVHTTFLGAHALPPEYADDRQGYIDHLCTAMLPAAAKAGLMDTVDGFCESIGFSPDEIRQLFDAAAALGLPVKLHAEQLSDQGGAALAAQYGALSADHLEYVSDAGVQAMAKAGTVAVLLPGAFYFLKETTKPPVALLRKHNVPIALATDCNPGSSPCTSILLMLNMGCTLFGLTPEEALRGVTANAAKALGLNDRGVLAIEKKADLAFWDINHPAELAYGLGVNPLRTMCHST